MKTVALGEISKSNGQYGVGLPSRGWRESDPRYIRITDIRDDGRLNSDIVAPDGEPQDWENAVLREGDLLFARSGATVGKTYLHPAGAPLAVYAGYLIRFELDTDRVLPKYVFRFTQSPAYRSFVASTQRAVAQPNINAKQYASLPIPLAPLEHQRRIVAILDHADSLRAKRRHAIGMLHSLAQSIYTEMFGQETSSARLDSVVLAMRNGVSPSRGGSAIGKVLTLSAVTGGRFDPSAWKESAFADAPGDGQRVSSSDFLICRGNGSGSLVGAGVHPPHDHPGLIFPDTIIAARFDPIKIDPIFLEAAWRQPATRGQIEAGARTTNGTFKVNQQTVGGVEIPLPTLESQREFASRIVAIPHSSENELDELFASLQSRAFAGQL